jgi:hypothetical protein
LFVVRISVCVIQSIDSCFGFEAGLFELLRSSLKMHCVL